jgi:hypothetical protein
MTLEKAFGVTSGRALCETCGWETRSHKNAQALASRHATAFGHRVSGEVAYAYSYDATGKKRKK